MKKTTIIPILLIIASNAEIAHSAGNSNRPFLPTQRSHTVRAYRYNNHIPRGGVFRDKSFRGSSSWSAGSSLGRNQQKQSSSRQQQQLTRLSDDFSEKEQQQSQQQSAKEREREAVKEEIDSFLTRDSRNTFIARVYAILTGQLTFVSLVIFAFMKFPHLQQWIALKGTLGKFIL
jgi:hypothetical protein